jgi:hypothetical protein
MRLNVRNGSLLRARAIQVFCDTCHEWLETLAVQFLRPTPSLIFKKYCWVKNHERV